MKTFSTDDRESATIRSGISGLMHRREPSYIGHHRLIILSVYYIALVLLLSSNILGISGAFHHFFSVSNLLLLVTASVVMAAYLWCRIKIVTTLSLMTVATQLSLTADTLYCAFEPMVDHKYMVIIINMLLLSGNTIVGLSTYLTRITQVNTAIMFVTYTVCIIATNNSTLIDYYFMLFVVLVFFSFLGFHIAKNARRLGLDFLCAQHHVEPHGKHRLYLGREVDALGPVVFLVGKSRAVVQTCLDDDREAHPEVVASLGSHIADVAHLLGDKRPVGEVLLVGRAMGVYRKRHAHLAYRQCPPVRGSDGGIGVEHLDFSLVAEVYLRLVRHHRRERARHIYTCRAHLETALPLAGLIFILGAQGTANLHTSTLVVLSHGFCGGSHATYRRA